MGLVTAKLLLRNPRATHLAVEAEALADSGAVHLCIPEAVRESLALEAISDNQVLIGGIPMEDMDLVIVPCTRTIDIDPASPDVATTIVKQPRAVYRLRSS